MKRVQNIGASVRQRLLNLSRAENRPFSEVLQYYGMERFLYRLSQSRYRDLFILKGALMLRVWHSPQLRPTMDIDLLGRTGNTPEAIESQIRDVLSIEIKPDSMHYDTATLTSTRITEDADYPGIRIRFLGSLDTARITLQLDIGFGDIVYPAPERSEFPTLLADPAPELWCYSRESAIAEKVEAMVKLGELNSRMKDFYDIWLLSRQFEFQYNPLAEALRRTFQHRDTALPHDLIIANDAFAAAKQVQWAAFRKRLQDPTIPKSFVTIAHALADFLEPVVSSLIKESPGSRNWHPGGPWNNE